MASRDNLPKSNKLDRLINCKVNILTRNKSSFIGTLLSFDNHMNLVLNDCEEFKTTKSRKEVKRFLGLIVIRGENVISVVMESQPNLSTLKPQLRLNKTKGSAKPIIKKINRNPTEKVETKSPAGVTKPKH